MVKETKKILFIGGHATPAFATLERFINEEAFELFWVGEKYNQSGAKNVSAEYKTVREKYRIPFIEFKSGKLIRFKGINAAFVSIKELFKLFVGFLKAIYIIIKINPDVIASFGGFLAVPIVIVGKLFGKKILTHEQTITVGLANKIIGKFADVIAISWEETRSEIKQQEKVVLTGNPIRKEVLEIVIDETERFNHNLPLLFIVCGNQGSHVINNAIFEILDELTEFTNVYHQTGNSSVTEDYNKSILLRDSLPEEKRNRYYSIPYVSAAGMGSLYKKSKLVISRAGANTVIEQLALGVPSILIPIPWASKNEQFKNAKVMGNIGIGKILEQKNLTGKELLKQIKNCLNILSKDKAFNQQSLKEVRKESSHKINTDADRKLEELIINLIR